MKCDSYRCIFAGHCRLDSKYRHQEECLILQRGAVQDLFVGYLWWILRSLKSIHLLGFTREKAVIACFSQGNNVRKKPAFSVTLSVWHSLFLNVPCLVLSSFKPVGISVSQVIVFKWHNTWTNYGLQGMLCIPWAKIKVFQFNGGGGFMMSAHSH